MASDMTDGSKTVKVSGKEIMLKDKSYFKKSTGDEAATKSLGMGVVTHQIQGKVYFTSWSMDVKFEGENVVRHLDLTTHNHASDPGQTPPWPHMDKQAIGPGGKCEKENEEIKKHCNPEKEWKKNCPTPPVYPASKPEYEAFAKKCEENPCINARKCMLVPYDKPGKGECCPGQTGDHLVDAASFLVPKSGVPRNSRERIDGWKNYDVNEAPCVCAEGPNQTTATHGQLHTRRGVVALGKGTWSRQEAAKVGAKALVKTFPSAGCSEACTEAQLNNYHDQAKSSDPEEPIKANSSMTSSEDARAAARVDMGVPVAPGPMP
jgi:hypothetical protein